MTQISRPFQIALVAVGLLAAVWLFALHGRSASSTESSGSAPASTPATTSGAAAQEKAAAAPTTVYKGAAPGVAGLTGAIAKAHGAVATSQQNAKELESKSAQASTTGAVRRDGHCRRALRPPKRPRRRHPPRADDAHRHHRRESHDRRSGRAEDGRIGPREGRRGRAPVLDARRLRRPVRPPRGAGRWQRAAARSRCTKHPRARSHTSAR